MVAKAGGQPALAADWVPFSPSSRVEITGGYCEYIDVSSCQDIIHLSTTCSGLPPSLNIVGLFLGIITAAVLGGFKDMVRKEVTSDFHRGPSSCKGWGKAQRVGLWGHVLKEEQKPLLQECSLRGGGEGRIFWWSSD